MITYSAYSGCTRPGDTQLLLIHLYTYTVSIPSSVLAELEFGLRDRNLGPGDHNLGLGDLGRLQSRTFSIPSRALDEIGFGLRDHILSASHLAVWTDVGSETGRSQSPPSRLVPSLAR